MKYEIHKGTVIAVDFDYTLCKSSYPECGEPIYEVIDFVKECKFKGATIILWTCREGEPLAKAVKWCESYGVPIDYVNENCTERTSLWGNNCRKIGADIYLDDKNICLDEITKRSRE